MSASDYAENAILNSIFGKTSDFGVLASAPTLSIALCTAAITDADTGATITEATYTGYARKTTSAGDWNAAAAGLIDNSGVLVFPECTAGSSTITHFALCDSGTLGAGSVILFGALDASLIVNPGITPQFNAGDLDLTCD